MLATTVWPFGGLLHLFPESGFFLPQSVRFQVGGDPATLSVRQKVDLKPLFKFVRHIGIVPADAREPLESCVEKNFVHW